MDRAVRPDPHFVARPDIFANIKQELLIDKERARIWIHGLPGFGKTTLAKALARDETIRATFPDGIVFVALGQQRDHLRVLHEIGRKLGLSTHATTVEQASEELEKVLQTRQCLLIIDDIWIDDIRNDRDVKPYNFPGTALAITTRQAIHMHGFTPFLIGKMDDEQSVAVLEHFLGQPHEDLKDLARRLYRWPLLLSLAGGNLYEYTHEKASPAKAIQWVARALEDNGLTVFDEERSEDRTRAVKACVEASLTEPTRFFCYATAIFPEDVDIPIDVLAEAWGLERYATLKLAGDFHKRSLLQLDLETETVRIHDALRDYYDGNLSHEDRIRLHGQLIDAWNEHPPNEYAWRHFRYHSDGAGRRAEFRGRISKFAWAFGKMKAVGLAEVLSDYEFFEDDDARLIAKTLRASAHAVQDDGDQLPSQIWGRLPEGRVEEFRAGARMGPGKTWLMPLHPTLPRADGAQMQTIPLPDSPYAMMLNQDQKVVCCGIFLYQDPFGFNAGNKIIDLISQNIETRPGIEWNSNGCGPDAFFYGHDGRTLMYRDVNDLRVFDVATGRELPRRKMPPSAQVTATSSTMAISATDRGELLLWDIESATIFGRCNGHDEAPAVYGNFWSVSAVAINPDATRAVSIGRHHGEVRVWSIDNGTTLRLHAELTRAELARFPTAVAISNDGQRLLIGLANGWLTDWHLPDQGPPTLMQCVHTAHAKSISFVAYSADCSFGLSASHDERTLRQWDLTIRANRPVDRHTRPILAVGLDSTGTHTASASTDGLIYLFSVHDIQRGRLIPWPPGGWSAAAFTHNLSKAIVHIPFADFLPGSPIFQFCTIDLQTDLITPIAEAWPERGQMAVSEDGKHVAYIGEEGCAVVLIKAASDQQLLAEKRIDQFRRIDISADGLTVVWGSVSGHIYVWRRGTDVRVAAPNDKNEPWTGGMTSAIAVTADGRSVLAIGTCGVVLWDIERWCLRKQFIAQDGKLSNMRVVALTPDERFAITGHFNHAVRLWDLQSETCIATFTGESAITALATNGEVIVVGEEAGYVHVLRIVNAAPMPR